MYVIIMAIIIKKRPWWPLAKTDQLAWFANYKVKAVYYKTILGLTDDNILSITNDEAMFRYFNSVRTNKNTYGGSFTVYEKQILNGNTQVDNGIPPVYVAPTVPISVKTGLKFRTFSFIEALKLNPAFTLTIQEEFKVIGEDYPPFDTDTYTANGKAKTTASYIGISTVKGKFIDGIEVFSQRGAETEFTSLGRVSKGIFKDDRYNLVNNKLEIRSYYTQAFVDNELIGLVSPTFTATWKSPVPPTPPIIP